MTETHHLPDAWDAALPADDNLVKAYIHGYAQFLEACAAALDWPTLRTDRFVAVDGMSPFSFQNCAVPLRPFTPEEVPTVIGEIEEFFRARKGGPFLLFGGFPIPDLSTRGWTLMGHPPLMLRPAGGAAQSLPDGLDIVPVTTREELQDFGITLQEAFPVPELAGQPYGGYGPGLLDVPGWHMWVGRVDGRAVATSGAYVHDGFVDVEWISNRPEARGRGVGAAVTWVATMADPELPAMLIASELGQPVYERMGYLRLTRFTLWTTSR